MSENHNQPTEKPTSKAPRRPTTLNNHTRLTKVVTAPVDPDESLLVALLITPVNPYPAKAYPFSVIFRNIEQSEKNLRKEEGFVQVDGITWWRRLIPYIKTVSVAVIFAICLTLITYTSLRLTDSDMSAWIYQQLFG